MNKRNKRRRKTDKGQETKANKTKEQMSGNEWKRAQITFKNGEDQRKTKQRWSGAKENGPRINTQGK